MGGGGGVVQAHFTDTPEGLAPVTGAPDGPLGGGGRGRSGVCQHIYPSR